MRTTLSFITGAILLLVSCDSTQSKTKPAPTSEPVIVIDATPEPLKELPEVSTEKEDAPEPYKKLIFNTKLSISSTQPNWVLFSNGTYILFPKGTSTDDMRQSSLGFLQRYNNESFTISKSQLVKGWIASSPKGIYNYVSLAQASSRMATNKELASIGKQNVLKDKANPIIVHINTPN